MPTITGAHHAALTVTDADASAAWYIDQLGMVQLLSGDDDAVSFRVLAHPDSGWIMGVRAYKDGANDTFDELRTGLDHLAFGVSNREELAAWETELTARGIPVTAPGLTDRAGRGGRRQCRRDAGRRNDRW